MFRKVMALLIISTFLFVPISTTSYAATSFKFSGKGWGHGLGMSQYGAKGFADKNRNYSAILAHYYKGTTLQADTATTLRVLIASGRSQVNFSATNDFKVYSEPLKKTYSFKGGHNYRSSIKSDKIYIRDITSAKDMGNFTQPLQVSGGNGLKLLTSDDNGYRNNKYRGWLRFLISGGRLSIVNYVNSEQYLYGVVPREMPASWRMEALKTQAVAARSYAFASVKKNTYFDLYATVYSQVYGGMSAENSRTSSAVARTAGKVLTYKGKIIQAFFHSSSGGKTENNEYVWGGSPLTWLRAASSPYEGSAGNWPSTYSYSASYVQSKLGKYSSYRIWGVKGKLKDLVVTKRAESPRVLSVRVVGTGGNSYITGGKLRSILGLRSTWFYINGKGTTSSNNPSMSLKATKNLIKAKHKMYLSGTISKKNQTISIIYKRGTSKWMLLKKFKLKGSTFKVKIRPSTVSKYVFYAKSKGVKTKSVTVHSR